MTHSWEEMLFATPTPEEIDANRRAARAWRHRYADGIRKGMADEAARSAADEAARSAEERS